MGAGGCARLAGRGRTPRGPPQVVLVPGPSVSRPRVSPPEDEGAAAGTESLVSVLHAERSPSRPSSCYGNSSSCSIRAPRSHLTAPSTGRE